MTATADIKTEILTKEGWKSPDKILSNDKILSLCEGYHTWSSVLISINYYIGDLITINCQSLKAQLTPTSEVLCRVRKKNIFSELQNIQIQKLKNQIAIPTVSNSETICDLSDDQIRLAGWLMTDGGFSFRDSCWTIYQSKPSDEIERVLKSNNLEFSTYIRERNIQSVCGKILKNKPLPQKVFRINKHSTKRVLSWVPDNVKTKLPEWFFNMSNNQFDILLGALIAGDGSKYKNKECYILYGKHQILSNIQYIAITHGWRANISVARERDFRLNLCKKQSIEFKPKDVICRKPYVGFVWTATTNAKNILVRRNGTAYFLPTN